LIYSPDGKLVGSSEGVLTRVEVENFIGHKWAVTARRNAKVTPRVDD
jgi:hypothetical protein